MKVYIVITAYNMNIRSFYTYTDFRQASQQYINDTNSAYMTGNKVMLVMVDVALLLVLVLAEKEV